MANAVVWDKALAARGQWGSEDEVPPILLRQRVCPPPTWLRYWSISLFIFLVLFTASCFHGIVSL